MTISKNKEIMISDESSLKDRIYFIRGHQVMLDSDIAGYFGIETGAMNRAMKRNIRRFPLSFCFQLAKDELKNLKCQIGISYHLDSYGGRRTLPFAYTEQGIAISTVLPYCLYTMYSILLKLK